MSKFDFDYFVIGGGSGGVRSARIAAGHGARVALAEAAELGGTCVNLGCVPKKLLAYGADFGAGFQDSMAYGWSFDHQRHSWDTLRENKNREIRRLNGIYQSLLERAGVKLIKGFAVFEDAHTVNVEGQRFTAKHILIATGGKPRRPVFPGAEHAIVSDDAFHLETLPHRVLIQGGGYVAVEFAHIFCGLGVKVDLIYRDTIFLKGFDADLREFLANEMRKQGCITHFTCDIDLLEKTADGFRASCADGLTVDTDMVFSAIGRVPNTDRLALDNAGVKTRTDGSIPVNESFQTNIRHIYAVGDIANTQNLTPVALAEGHILADNLFGGGKKRTLSRENIATAIFSHPPIGTVGLSEEDAVAKGYAVTVFKTSFRPMLHTLTGRDEKTFMKLVVDNKTDRVLGVHMCGRDAPEILQGFAVALNCGATKADFDRTIGIHPTSAEEFVTMREAFKGD